MTLEQLEERLKTLERRLSSAKRQNAYLMALVVVMTVIVALGGGVRSVQASLSSDVIRAQRFELVDASGRVRGALKVEGDTPGLWLWTKEGDGRAELSVINDDPMLRLFDKKGRRRGAFSMVGMNVAMGFWDERGVYRAEIGVVGGAPWLKFIDDKGRLIWRFP